MHPNRGREPKDSIHGTREHVESEEITRLDLPQGSDAETVILHPKTDAPAPAQHFCPHCKAELFCVTSIIWCLRCGYTKSVETEAENTSARAQRDDVDMRKYLGLLHSKAERQKLELELSTLKKGGGYIPIIPIRGWEIIPEWFAVLVCGVLICAIGSFTVAMNLRASPESRHNWCLAQAGVGATALALGHILAWVIVFPRKRRLRHGAILFTPWVWLMAWRALPQTRWAWWSAVWGIALVAGAVLIEAACLRGWLSMF